MKNAASPRPSPMGEGVRSSTYNRTNSMFPSPLGEISRKLGTKRFRVKRVTKSARLLLFLLALSSTVEVSAQNDILLTHFMFHEHVFNPAAAGRDRNLTLGFVARQQWTGFDNAPSTQALNGSLFIPKARSGVGVVLTIDRLGFERYINARFSYAYHQRVGKRAKISAGISLGLLNTYVKGSELTFEQTNDVNAFNTDEGEVKFDISLGLEFSTKNIFAGFAISHLHQSLGNSTVYKVPRHYFGYAKYNWEISKKVMLTPAIFVRSSEFITQAEVNLSATWSKVVITGLSYRSVDDMAAMLGVIIVKKVYLIYSFDFDFGEIKSHNSGSHEISLVTKLRGLKETSTEFKSPRYY